MRRYLYSLAMLTIFCFVQISCSKNCIPRPPKADFIYQIINPGVLPTTVIFKSTSTNATSYEWQFGDGTKFEITEDTISHIYTYPGDYAVYLIAIGRWGKDTAVKYVSITSN